MNMIPYTYLVLRYVHDQGAGETLNVGVLMFAKRAGFLDVALEHRYERLSSTFVDFDGDHYRRGLARLRTAIERVKKDLHQTLLNEPPEHTKDVLARLWTDSDSSFQWGPQLGGVAADLSEELTCLFDRMVTSQYPVTEEAPRRDDDYIWRHVFQRKLGTIAHELTSKRFVTPHIEMEFPHALKNGAWHVIQPVSLDFKSADTIQKKATQWLGTTVGLRRASDLGQIFFLLGKPTHATKSHKRAYERAKALLDQSPVAHELIEEENAGELAGKLEALLKRHE